MSFKNQNVTQDDNSELQKLMCSVPGCPNRWSVNMGKPMCSFHQWGPRTQNSTSKIIDTWYNKDKDEAM